SAVDATVGLSTDDLWRVQESSPGVPDEKVCPLCRSVNRVKRKDWPWRLSDGPPCHPNDRCYVEYVNVPVKEAVGRMLEDSDYKSLSLHRESFDLNAWYRTAANAPEWRAHCRKNEIEIDDLTAFKSFNPNEPRAKDGRWMSGGSDHDPSANDKYVLRRTSNPDADLKRGWSAWGGIYTDSPLDNPEVDNKMAEEGKDVYDIINAIGDDNTHETEEGWEINDTPEAKQAVAEWIDEELGLDMRKDPTSGKWALFHHHGLSSYELESTHPDAAVNEGRRKVTSGEHDFLTGGHTGIDPVAYHHVGDDKYVFRVRDTGIQRDS